MALPWKHCKEGTLWPTYLIATIIGIVVFGALWIVGLEIVQSRR